MPKIIKYVRNPYKIFVSLAARGCFKNLNDKTYIELMYRGMMGKKLNLENPQSFNEKLQWLKIHDRKEIYTTMVDKYEAKKYVAKRIGEEYIVPTLGVWEHFSDIDFSMLPEQFVLKTTHDSGGVIICKDKDSFEVKKAKEIIEKSLKNNFYYWSREYPYKNVKPRIIAEEYLSALEKADEVIEYKVFCFDGEPALILVCKGEGHSAKRTNDFYDMEFNHIPVTITNPNAEKISEKPEQFDELLDLSRELAKGIPQVRTDFYIVNGKIYFGELTFFHDSGYCHFEPEKYDRIFGNMITLPRNERK